MRKNFIIYITLCLQLINTSSAIATELDALEPLQNAMHNAQILSFNDVETKTCSKLIQMQPDQFALITTLYNETHPHRMAEYQTCIERNLSHPSIGAYIILYDTSKDNHQNILLNFMLTKPLYIIPINSRASFGQCFTVANNLFIDGTKTIVSNADIYFDYTLDQLKTFSLDNIFLALTRSEPKRNGGLAIKGGWDQKNSSYSQDVWIFTSPIRTIPNTDNIFLGTHYCDCKIAFQAKQAGFNLYNPCRTIHCIHLHTSKVRNWQITQQPSNVARLRTSYLPQSACFPAQDDYAYWTPIGYRGSRLKAKHGKRKCIKKRKHR